jgi:cyclophilin family peptidyl-prolyl cis-trans isomerase/HEAT repeat protein
MTNARTVASFFLLGAVTSLWGSAPVVASGAGSDPVRARTGTVLSDEVAILRIEDRREDATKFFDYLASPDPQTRARACRAIGRVLGPLASDQSADATHDLLATHLRADPDARVRGEAAFALGLLQSARAAAILASVLVAGAETDPTVLAIAAEGLGRCGPDAHPQALARALDDPDRRVVRAALLAAWKGKRADHHARLLALSEKADPEIRWRAAYALMRSLGAPPSGRTAVPGGGELALEAIARIEERMLTLAADGDLRVRLQALRALGRCPAESDLHARAAAIAEQALDDPDVRIRVEALRSLGALLEGAGSSDAILRGLADPSCHVRVTAIEAAGRVFKAPELPGLLSEKLVAPSSWERASAFTVVIGSMTEARQPAEAARLIARAGEDAEWTVRYAAAEGLGGLLEHERAAEARAAEEHGDAEGGTAAANSPPTGRAARQMLLQRFLADDPRVAKACVTPYLSQRPLTPEGAASLLRDAGPYLASDDEVMRALALEGTNAYLQALMPDPDTLPSADAAATIGETAMNAFATRAEQAREDSSPDVRASAASVLQTLATLRQSAEQAAEASNAAEAGAGGAAPQPAVATASPSSDWGDADYARALRLAHRAQRAIIETAGGEIEVALFGEDAPLTVHNFVQLAERGYFDKGVWHRVVPDFVVQDGCPRGDGWGGPGWTIRCEINPHHYEPGVLGMALSGKDTGGSQFFFTLADQPHLDGRYTIFGRIVRGMELLLGTGGEIRQGETEITRVRIVYAE